MTSSIQIIGSPLSPYVRKVLAVLRHKGLAFELDPIVPFCGSEAFTALSPLRRIPVYRDQYLTLCDSSVICQYLWKTAIRRNPSTPRISRPGRVPVGSRSTLIHAWARYSSGDSCTSSRSARWSGAKALIRRFSIMRFRSRSRKFSPCSKHSFPMMVCYAVISRLLICRLPPSFATHRLCAFARIRYVDQKWRFSWTGC